MERPRAPSINSRSRSLIASVNRPEAGPTPITRGPRTIGSALRASVGSVQTAASTTGAVVGTKFDVPLATRVEERVSDGLRPAPTLLRLALVARAQVGGIWGS
jgi:hypothetical protein